MNAQKQALQKIKESGSVEGINRRTVEALERRGNIKGTANGWTLTKRGESRLAGRLGNSANLSRMWEGKTRESTLKAARIGSKPIRKTRKTKAKDKTAFQASRKTEIQKATEKESAALLRVLGEKGIANAVKIAQTSGALFTQRHVEAFRSLGWGVEGASSIAAKPGNVALNGWEEIEINPEPLGKRGTSRALVLIGPVDRETVMSLRREGFDVSPAPAKFKTIKNPGTKARAAKIAMKKAQAWFWDETKVSEPEELVGYVPPESGILVGEIVAIEYRSAKDGRMKTYRHDVTKKRDLIISVDGQTLIVNPGFKITKRGIEG